MPKLKDQSSQSNKIRRPLFRRVLFLNLILSLLLAGAAVAAAFFAVGKAVEISARADIEAEINILDQQGISNWLYYARNLYYRIPPEERILDLRVQWERDLAEKNAENSDVHTRSGINLNSSSSVYIMTNKAGSLLIGNVARWPDGVPYKNGWQRFDGKDAGALPGAIIANIRIVDDEGYTYTLIVGRRLAAYDALYQGFIPAMIVIALTMATVSAFFTSLFARGFNARVNILNAVFRDVHSGAVNARIPASSLNQGDELAQLGGEINATLDEITRLMKGLDAVSQTAAHELNKEVSQLQVLARDSGDETLANAADALQRLLREILELARIESSPGFGMRPMNITNAVQQAIELYNDAYDDQSVTLTFASANPAANVLGRAPLITNMAANLLNNALKHTPKGGAVSVMLAADGDAVTLSVADTGHGTDTDNIAELIARGATGPVAGYGFGLRFVQAVAIRHGARVTLKNRKPGMAVTIAFPKISKATS